MNKLSNRRIWLILLVVVINLALFAGIAFAGKTQPIGLNFYEPRQPERQAFLNGAAGDLAAETADTPAVLSYEDKLALEEPAHTPPMAAHDGPSVVLYDNGPLVNSPGTGVGGADESVLQNTSLLMNILGFGHQISAGNWVADDFTVTDAAGWTITEITFFAYQTGSSTTSTMTDVRLRIWDGPPGAGSSVIWGDTTTNLLSATGWTNIYRVAEDTSGTATNRPIMYNTAVVNTFLPQGTYWLDWQAGGTLASGPWAPPITINGQATTGNGLQSTDGGVTYVAAEDSGSLTQQGLPFVIEGDVGATSIPSITLDKTVAVFGSGCPGTDSITVAPGTDVEYCYEVANTGTVTLTRHDLVDDQLGTLVTDFPFVLGPGDVSGAGVGPVTINATTVNSATWTAYNPGPTDVAQASDTATVIVSGPAPLVCNGDPATFDAGIPTDWMVANNAPANPVVWDSIAACGESGNFTGGTGEAACASSDLQGGGSGLYDTELWSPPIDLTGVGQPELTFWANYQNFAGVDRLDVDISTDGGTTWDNLMSWNGDHGTFRAAPGEMVTLDLTAYIGESNVIVRWHYYDPTGPATSQDWYAQLDDVSLSCISGPAIELNKTVGLDPAVCATGDQVFVTPGSDVTYCYEVTNTGTIVLNQHDLVDDQLGTILSNFPYPLSPGASVWLTQTTTIQSSVVNYATWTAYNPGPVDVVTAVDSAEVLVGADSLVCNGNPVRFESGIPASFTTAANGPVYWSTTDDLTACDNGGNQTSGYGNAACADADETNSAADPYDAEMWTNSFDLTGYASAYLTFDAAYNDISTDPGIDLFDVDVSTDGGATWTNLLSWDEDHYNPSEMVMLDLGAYIGNPSVLARFRYYGTGWNWWAQVDDIGLDCGLNNIYLPVIMRMP